MNAARILSVALALVPFSLRTLIHRIPGLAPLQRMVVSRLGSGTSFEHRISAGPAKGLVFRVKLPDDKLYWAGHWEADVTEALAKLVRPGAVCCDVGGHRGFMSGVMALNGAAEVHCFEPNPANIEKIEDLQDLNPSLPIKLHTCAVGADDGQVTFEVLPDAAMGKIAGSEFQFGRAGAERLTVALHTLDNLHASGTLPGPDLVKIDIEGAELDALMGAANLISTYRPSLLIEVHTHALLEKCAGWLRQHDYDLSVIEQPLATITADDFRVCHLLARPMPELAGH